jgi:hypothetical protein
MNALGILVIVAGPVLAIAWLVAEFKAQRAWRIILGLLSMVILTTVAVMATLLNTQLHYNSYYGFATKALIEESVIGLESGHTSFVLTELRRLQQDYQPTYENRARFVPLVEATVERLKQESGKIPQPDGPANGSQPIRSETNTTSSAAGSRR